MDIKKPLLVKVEAFIYAFVYSCVRSSATPSQLFMDGQGYHIWCQPCRNSCQLRTFHYVCKNSCSSQDILRFHNGHW